MSERLHYFTIHAEPMARGVIEITVFYRTKDGGAKRRIDAEFDPATGKTVALSDRLATDATYGEGA